MVHAVIVVSVAATNSVHAATRRPPIHTQARARQLERQPVTDRHIRAADRRQRRPTPIRVPPHDVLRVSPRRPPRPRTLIQHHPGRPDRLHPPLNIDLATIRRQRRHRERPHPISQRPISRPILLTRPRTTRRKRRLTPTHRQQTRRTPHPRRTRPPRPQRQRISTRKRIRHHRHRRRDNHPRLQRIRRHRATSAIRGKHPQPQRETDIPNDRLIRQTSSPTDRTTRRPRRVTTQPLLRKRDRSSPRPRARRPRQRLPHLRHPQHRRQPIVHRRCAGRGYDDRGLAGIRRHRATSAIRGKHPQPQRETDIPNDRLIRQTSSPTDRTTRRPRRVTTQPLLRKRDRSSPRPRARRPRQRLPHLRHPQHRRQPIVHRRRPRTAPRQIPNYVQSSASPPVAL